MIYVRNGMEIEMTPVGKAPEFLFGKDVITYGYIVRNGEHAGFRGASSFGCFSNSQTAYQNALDMHDTYNPLSV